MSAPKRKLTVQERQTYLRLLARAKPYRFRLA